MILSGRLQIILAMLFSVVATSRSNAELAVDQPRSRKPRLAGGIHVDVGDHSYMASLQEYKNHICAGTIYSKTIILTAAHCVIGKWYEALSVRVGSLYRDRGGQILKVARVAYHQEFISSHRLNDIALLKLEKDVQLNELHSEASTVELFKDDDQVRPGSLVTVVGWGYFDSREIFSDHMMELSMPTIPKEKCRWNIENNHSSSVPRKQICAQCRPGKGCSCPGDSGGPVMFKGRQVGIISTGTCDSKQPESFPELSAYRDWIDKNIEELDKPDREPFVMHPMSTDDKTWNRYRQGKPILIENAPFLVAFVTKGSILKCTGTIIGPKYILTSASCAEQIDITEDEVRAGSSDFRTGGVLKKIASIIRHKKYYIDKFGRPVNDIALVEIDVKFDEKLKVAKLFSGEKISPIATVYGWSAVDQSSSTRKERFALKESSARLMIVPNVRPHCGVISAEVKRSQGRFCAISKLTGMCVSNNGGPIMADDHLLGVVSWTNKECANFWYPAVYTGVLYFRDWIHESMTKLDKELR